MCAQLGQPEKHTYRKRDETGGQREVGREKEREWGKIKARTAYDDLKFSQNI